MKMVSEGKEEAKRESGGGVERLNARRTCQGRQRGIRE